MQHKIQRMQVGQLISLNVAAADSRKVLLHALCRDLADQHGIVLRLESNEPDIGVISLVARSCMRNLPKLYLHTLAISRKSNFTMEAEGKELKDCDCHVIPIYRSSGCNNYSSAYSFPPCFKGVAFHLLAIPHHCDHGGTTPVMRAYAMSCPICSLA